MRSASLVLVLWLWASCSAAYGQGQVLNRTLQHDGRTRSYSLYIPPGYTGEEAWPLVFNLHFLTSTASEAMTFSRMNTVADSGHFLVAYPNATVSPQIAAPQWNDGTMYPNGPDDVGFISALIDELEGGYHIDPSKVYAAGSSNGGVMSYYLGSKLSHRIAAIASVAGTHVANPTAPRPLPVLHFHGTADPILPFEGGFANVMPPLNTFRFPAVADVIDAWRDSNNSVGDPIITQLPNLNTTDGSTVEMIQYQNCDRYVTASGEERPAEILYYRITGGGHPWPGGGDHPAFAGPMNRDINGSEEIWKFFSRHELAAGPVSNWVTDADGIWSKAPNWNNGIVRNAVDAEAVFGAVITQPRAVNLDMPITLGRIDFESTKSYTVEGTNSITLDVANGVANINVNSGSHTIGAPVILADHAVVSVWPAANNLSITAGLNAANVNLVKAGAGALTVSQLRSGRLTINGGKVVVAPNGTNAATSMVSSLSIAGGAAPIAKLDLTDNAAVIDYTGTSPVPTVRQQIVAGRGGVGLGKGWNGMGITSSNAALDNATYPESRSIGYAENFALPLGPYTTFRGQTVDSTSLIIAFTRTGDANLDGVVNDDDVTIVGAAYAPGVPQPSWALGDFDYNGFVDDDDVTLLNAFYDPSAPPLNSPAAPGAAVAAVPEPASLILALVAAVGISALFRLRHACPRRST